MKIRPQFQSGFTLIEVVISSALMAIIIVSAYLCFSASMSAKKAMEPRLEVIQNARVAMALISADLRSACPLDKDSQFIGMHRMLGETAADNLDFATHHFTPRKPREGDFCETSYYLDANPETGRLSLWRRQNPTIAPDPLSGGMKQEIAQDVAGLRFEYFDGFDWYDSWGDADGRDKQQFSQKEQPNLSGMPEAVRVTLWFDSDPVKTNSAANENSNPGAPMVFQTVARLELAGASQSDSGNNPSPGAASDSTGQSQQPGAAQGGAN